MTRICIVEKYPSQFNYLSVFPFEFDKYSLVPEKQDKVLVRDVQLDIKQLQEDYDYLILVGKEPCKMVGKITSVTEYQGYLMDEKYLGLLNPAAVRLRPSLQASFDKAIDDICSVIDSGDNNNCQYETKGLQTEDEIEEYLIALLSKVESGEVTKLAVDTEDSSLYAREGFILGICLAYVKESGVYIDALSITDKIINLMQRIFNEVTCIFHNKKFDHKWLEYHFGFVFPNWEDTMLLHYVLDEKEGSHGLKNLALKYTDLGDYDRDLVTFKNNYCKRHGVLKRDFSYDFIPFDIMVPYASLDAAATLELFEKFYPLVEKNSKLMAVYTELLKAGTDFLIQVEENGIPINIELTHQYIKDIDDEIKEKTETLYTYDEVKVVEKNVGKVFNTNSTAHKQALFFDVLGLSPIKMTPGLKPSTDAETIEALSEFHELPELINTIMKLKKIKSTYLEKYIAEVDGDNRLRTGFNLHTTTSGRLSSSGKINAQQLPRKDKRPKRCIEAREGFKIVSQDLKTAEMYVAAVLSGDRNLQHIFKTGEDYHGFMAIQKFGLSCKPNEVAELFPDLRQAAKTISFEILYKLNYREPVLKRFPQLKDWLQDQEQFIKQSGYIYSAFGRKRRLKDVFSPNKKEAQHWVRSGINFLVQSVSSDINLLAGVDMQEWIVENGYQKDMVIFGLVHDSILAEVRDEVLDIYTEKLAYFTQKERHGMFIPGYPIGLDLEVGTNYAFIE